MRRSRLKLTVMLILPLLAVPAVASAEQIQAALNGYQEVPSVSTVASGEFRARISPDGQSIDYELTYSGLQGSVQQGHIHVAQLSVNGSIVIWLCQTASPFLDPTRLAPQCPSPGGTVTGHITSANVIAGSMAPQQLAAGDLGDVIAAIRAGAAYANVHTNLSPGGEIRGQIRASNRRDREDEK
jgi:CHRD domain